MTKFATENEPSIDNFYAELCLALCASPDDHWSRQYIDDVAIEKPENQFGHSEDHSINVCSGKKRVQINFTRFATGMYYRGDRVGMRRCTYQDEGYRTKSMPQKKDGTFSYDKIIDDILGILARKTMKDERFAREQSGMHRAKTSVSLLDAQLGFSEIDNLAVVPRNNGNINITLTDMNEEQARMILKAINKFDSEWRK